MSNTFRKNIEAPNWIKNQAIYEVNLRQYTKGGTFGEFEEHLPRLKELGVGVLWFMPIQPIGQKSRKGSLGSYYSIQNYTAINPEFGTMEEFKSLVKKIHDLGMKVIIDWVANHTAWDHHWTIDHPDFFDRNENGDFLPPNPEWTDVIHLNYGNPALWYEMISQMEFWIRETDVDGFRCDMAHLVTTLFWNHARYHLDKVKPVFMLAETENHDLVEFAFDVIYNWKLLHGLNDLAAGRINAADVLTIAKNGADYLPKGAAELNFTENHDENSWNGSAIERIHYFLEPVTVLTFTLPGIPLIYSGQEAGNYKRLSFFDKDEIPWKEDKMSRLYQTLIEVRKRNPALWSGSGSSGFQMLTTSFSPQVAAFKRFSGENEVIVVANLGHTEVTGVVEMNADAGAYLDIFTLKEYNPASSCQLTLPAFGYKVCEKNVISNLSNT
jgi:glycosidase